MSKDIHVPVGFSKDDVVGINTFASVAQDFIDDFGNLNKSSACESGKIKRGELKGTQYQIYGLNGENYPQHNGRLYAKIVVGEDSYYCMSFKGSKAGTVFKEFPDGKIIYGKYEQGKKDTMSVFRGRNDNFKVLNPNSQNSKDAEVERLRKIKDEINMLGYQDPSIDFPGGISLEL